MKSYALLLLGMLTACQGTRTLSPVIDSASSDTCEQAYNHMLQLVISEEIDPENSFSTQEREAAITLLNKEYTKTGKLGKFMNYCTFKMSETQAQCLLKVHSLTHMKLCK